MPICNASSQNQLVSKMMQLHRLHYQCSLTSCWKNMNCTCKVYSTPLINQIFPDLSKLALHGGKENTIPDKAGRVTMITHALCLNAGAHDMQCRECAAGGVNSPGERVHE